MSLAYIFERADLLDMDDIDILSGTGQRCNSSSHLDQLATNKTQAAEAHTPSTFHSTPQKQNEAWFQDIPTQHERAVQSGCQILSLDGRRFDPLAELLHLLQSRCYVFYGLRHDPVSTVRSGSDYGGDAWSRDQAYEKSDDCEPSHCPFAGAARRQRMGSDSLVRRTLERWIFRASGSK